MTRRSLLQSSLLTRFIPGILGILPAQVLASAISRKEKFRLYALIGIDESNIPTVEFKNNSGKEAIMTMNFVSALENDDKIVLTTEFSFNRSVPDGVGGLAIGTPDGGEVQIAKRIS